MEENLVWLGSQQSRPLQKTVMSAYADITTYENGTPLDKIRDERNNF
jgi:hypothetical protein